MQRRGTFSISELPSELKSDLKLFEIDARNDKLTNFRILYPQNDYVSLELKW